MASIRYEHKSLFLLIWTVVFIALAAGNGHAGDYGVTPTSLTIENGKRSGFFTVGNYGNTKIDIQVTIKEWTQDSTGKDIESDTSDIVFFPKIMTIEPNGQQTVRIGIKGSQPGTEKTYRLIVKELPIQKKTETDGKRKTISAAVAIVYQFAYPIFIEPGKKQISGQFEKIEASKRKIKATIVNTGNATFKRPALSFLGKSADNKVLFSREIPGWYILPGNRRTFEADIPAESCGGVSVVEVIANTVDGHTIRGMLNVQKELCIR